MTPRPAAEEVADRVYRVEHAHVNVYLVRNGDDLLLVDAGLPRHWARLMLALEELRLGPEALRALVITHGHFDHLGTARRLQREFGVPVWAHPDDFFIAEHPYRYDHERSRPAFLALHPSGARIVTRMALGGALGVRGITDLQAFRGGDELDVPGSPTAIATPGHTDGHCALHLPDHGVVFSGDALVTLDPYTGRTGPRIVAGAATADSPRAKASLAAIGALSGSVLLPGHGAPWYGAMQDAEAIARSNTGSLR